MIINTPAFAALMATIKKGELAFLMRLACQMNELNQVLTTAHDLSKELSVSKYSLGQWILGLQNANAIKRRRGYFMINPAIIRHDAAQVMLYKQYNAMKNQNYC